MKQQFTPPECIDMMLAMRAYDMPDETIGAMFEISRQRVHVLCGPRERKRTPPAELPPDLPALLKTWREFRGLSKAAAARELQMPQSTYLGIENGRRNPSAFWHAIANSVRADMKS